MFPVVLADAGEAVTVRTMAARAAGGMRESIFIGNPLLFSRLKNAFTVVR
jgi:hypothetical protein